MWGTLVFAGSVLVLIVGGLAVASWCNRRGYGRRRFTLLFGGLVMATTAISFPASSVADGRTILEALAGSALPVLGVAVSIPIVLTAFYFGWPKEPPSTDGTSEQALPADSGSR